MTNYLEISATVPAEVELSVIAAVRYAMKALKIGRPIKYAFFVPREVASWHGRRFADDIDLGGCVFHAEPDKIWVRSDVPPLEARHIALHETFHATHIELPGGHDGIWEERAPTG